jgi:hypothetical protein
MYEAPSVCNKGYVLTFVIYEIGGAVAYHCSRVFILNSDNLSSVTFVSLPATVTVVRSAEPSHLDVTFGWTQNLVLAVLMDPEFLD